MTEPQPVMAQAEQDQLTRQVGRALLTVAGEGWTQVRAEYRSAGRHIEVDVFVSGPDGAPRPVRPPAEVVDGLGKLRQGMYRPGRGTWLSALYVLEPPSSFSAEFEPDVEPRWRRVPPPIGFADELRFFPRADEHIPEWLRVRAGLRAAGEPTPPGGVAGQPGAGSPGGPGSAGGSGVQPGVGGPGAGQPGVGHPGAGQPGEGWQPGTGHPGQPGGGQLSGPGQPAGPSAAQPAPAGGEPGFGQLPPGAPEHGQAGGIQSGPGGEPGRSIPTQSGPGGGLQQGFPPPPPGVPPFRPGPDAAPGGEQMSFQAGGSWRAPGRPAW
ncbi:MAG: hypothetical protein ACRDSK_12690 [Actinophytocola sp.]|uniref:hypothetical protein n=1 Tax=Actinophytocola sp. TaxID=1872138 RepID=UPI003D6A252C